MEKEGKGRGILLSLTAVSGNSSGKSPSVATILVPQFHVPKG